MQMCRPKRLRSGSPTCVLRNDTTRAIRRKEIYDTKRDYELWPYPYPTDIRMLYGLPGIATLYALSAQAWNAPNSDVAMGVLTDAGHRHMVLLKSSSDPTVVERYRWEAGLQTKVFQCVAYQNEALHFLRYFGYQEEGAKITLVMQYPGELTLDKALADDVNQHGGNLSRDGYGLIFQALAALAILHSKCNVVLGKATADRFLVERLSSPQTVRYVVNTRDQNGAVKNDTFELSTSLRLKLFNYDYSVDANSVQPNDNTPDCVNNHRCRDVWLPARDSYELMSSIMRDQRVQTSCPGLVNTLRKSMSAPQFADLMHAVPLDLFTCEPTIGIPVHWLSRGELGNFLAPAAASPTAHVITINSDEMTFKEKTTRPVCA